MVSLPTIKGAPPPAMEMNRRNSTKLSLSEFRQDGRSAMKMDRHASSKISLTVLQRDETISSPTDNAAEGNIDIGGDTAPGNSHTHCYVSNCFKDSISPDKEVLRFFEQQQHEELILQHKRMRIKEWNALFRSLIGCRVATIDFSCSNIKPNCFKNLQCVLTRNENITKLDLSNVSLHGKGASILGNAFVDTEPTIQTLVLSQCHLDGNDLKMFKNYFSASMTLQELCLSSNNIGEDGGLCCGNILKNNRHLEKLDLSWNQIRRSGACSVMEGLKHNDSLLDLNISFNGLGDDGAMQTGVMLEINDTLVALNLRDNRMTNQGLQYIAFGLTQNKTLTSLNLSGNLVTAPGMQFMLAAAIKSGCLHELFIKQVSPDSLCSRAIEHLKNTIPNMVIEHGVASNGETRNKPRAESFTAREEVFDEIRMYISDERLRLLDLFKMWDKNKSGNLTREEIGRGLETSGIIVTEAILEQVFKSLDNDKSGVVDYVEFIQILTMS